MRTIICLLLLALAGPVSAQDFQSQLANLAKPHDYVLRRSSSYDRTGGNADARQLPPGGRF